jgi:hypothetical protein
MLLVFQIHVASVCSKYFICFQTYVAIVFYLDVASICSIVFRCFIRMFVSVSSGFYICLQWFSNVSQAFLQVFEMFTMVFKCFSSVFASVSDVCFKCFICLFFYVLHIGCMWEATALQTMFEAVRVTSTVARVTSVATWIHCWCARS